jgi:hypothetical protein
MVEVCQYTASRHPSPAGRKELLTAKAAKKIRKGRKAKLWKLFFFASFAASLSDLGG